MTKKIFVWNGHPKPGSLSGGLADAYANAANTSGADVRRMNTSDMRFELDDFAGYGKAMELEPDLIAWQDAIRWADHLLFVYPYWWGGMPGKTKAVLDRALLPGFAFKYRGNGMKWDKLLTDKTGDGIITSDTPPWFDTVGYRKPGRRVLANQVLGFTGVKVKNIVQFGTVRTATPAKIAGWIARAEKMGHQAAAA